MQGLFNIEQIDPEYGAILNADGGTSSERRRPRLAPLKLAPERLLKRKFPVDAWIRPNIQTKHAITRRPCPRCGLDISVTSMMPARRGTPRGSPYECPMCEHFEVLFEIVT
jgi:predicted RNA-binding Zn-ribbon protein involved in translation (DUF1610 family)